jgi:sulfur-oxidizing protein SoxB
VPEPIPVSNAGGKTLVTNAGSNGKYLAVIDLDIKPGKLAGVRYKLLPVFSDLLKADPQMTELIDRLYEPHLAMMSEKIATPDELLYRRGNFNGSTDTMLCEALRGQLNGFRWGPTLLPGALITMKDRLDQTATTYSEVYVQEMTGEQIKSIMEDVCDNLFNPDPYYQQGGDMVRVGGLAYTCAPGAAAGSRISDLRLGSGKQLEAAQSYRVAGWASVNEQQGKPVWDIAAEYLKKTQHYRTSDTARVDVKGVSDNPGFAGAV